jgi:hypothetical protein
MTCLAVFYYCSGPLVLSEADVILSVEVFGTTPLVTFFIVSDAKTGFIPWKSWADTHSHYSVVVQAPGFAWKNVPELAIELEMFRWSPCCMRAYFFRVVRLCG